MKKLVLAESLSNLKRRFISPENIFLMGVFAVLVILFFIASTSAGFFAKSIIGLLAILLTLFIAKYNIILGIYGLMIWFAFEPVLLKIIPQNLAVLMRFAPEGFVYLLLASVIFYQFKKGKLIFIRTPINTAFLAFICVGILSAIFNRASPMIAILGLRQIIRFILVFYLVLYAKLSRKSIKNIFYILGAITIIQIILAFLEVVTGGAIDSWLLPSSDVIISEGIILEGIEQFWEEGQRVFGTFTRYNQLGSFLVLMVSLALAALYELKMKAVDKKLFIFVFIMTLITVVFTYSRASWIAVFAVIVLIAIKIKKDKMFLLGLIATLILSLGYISTYVIGNQLSVSLITDQAEASLVERILEPFSAASLKGGYDGFGRLYFLINTPAIVVKSAPLLGVGPGYYGGGVAAALGNKQVYNELGLPFGVYGEIGQIDNNWFSIWGEFGTLGLLLFIIILIRLYKGAQDIYNTYQDHALKGLSLALRGMIVGIIILGLFAPYFEIKTLMFYFWLTAGCTYSLAYQYKAKQSNIKIN